MTNVTTPEAPKRVVVLAVSGDETELSNLRCLFAGSSWGLRTARTIDEAIEWLIHHKTGVVLCDSRLPDGDWKALLRLTAELAHSPNLIVASRDADERLWAEVLNMGGFDVLALPAKEADFFHALSNAWRNWEDRSHRNRATQVRVLACAS